jgi:hypothetical protein
MKLQTQEWRGIVIGLMVGLLASAGVASASHTPVYAFTLSAVTVLIVVGLVAVVTGLVRR